MLKIKDRISWLLVFVVKLKPAKLENILIVSAWLINKNESNWTNQFLISKYQINIFEQHAKAGNARENWNT